MNKLFKFFLPLVAVCAVAVSCSDDKDDEPVPPSQEIAGKYMGGIAVAIPPGEAGDAADAEILLTQVGDKVKMELVKSDFNALIKGGAVVINDVTVTKSGDKYTLAGAGKVTLAEGLDPSGTPLAVTITGSGKPADLKLSIAVPFGGATINVDFSGARK